MLYHHPLRRPLSVAALVIAAFCAFRTFPNNPFWPRDAAGRNYVANLHPGRFLPGSEWLNSAHWAMADWQYEGGTSFVYAVQQIAADSNNHADGFNTWDHVNWGNNSVLAVTYVNWVGNQMTDCDIQFNLYYPWTSRTADPNADHSAQGYEMRAVARHESGHALGLDHEDALLDSMNSIYSDGAGIPHLHATVSGRVYGMLPHADDKFGCRILYPPGVPNPTTNLMCTSWREPVPGSGQARKLYLSSSTYGAGASIQVPFLVENQSNVWVPGGPSGVRVGVYLSTDAFINTFDTLIGSSTFGGNFGPHATGFYTLNATIPPTMVAGNYYVGVLVDDTNLIAETTEGDNFAWYGPIRVDNLPDLVITQWSVSPINPERGSNVTITMTVQNIGFGASLPSAVHTYLQATSGPADPRNHLIGAPNIVALPPSGSVTIPYVTTIPPDICGGMPFVVHGDVDLGGWNQESNENNNSAETTLTPQWPAAPGRYLGVEEPYVDGFGSLITRICTKVQGPTPVPGSWYLIAMGCSGSTPGVPFPSLGTLLLNVDVCTQIGLTLEGGWFTGSRGVQSSGPAGSVMSIQSGTWLTPLRGLPLDFAAIYLDPTLSTITALSSNSVRLVVR